MYMVRKPTVNYMPYNRSEQLRTPVHNNTLWHGNYFLMFLIKLIVEIKRMIVVYRVLILKVVNIGDWYAVYNLMLCLLSATTFI